MNKLGKEKIEFITKCLNEGKLLPDSYKYMIPFETKKELKRILSPEDSSKYYLLKRPNSNKPLLHKGFRSTGKSQSR